MSRHTIYRRLTTWIIRRLYSWPDLTCPRCGRENIDGFEYWKKGLLSMVRDGRRLAIYPCKECRDELKGQRRRSNV